MDFNKAVFEASFGLASQLPASDLPEIAVSGRSNVGKSSLINRLFSRKNLARVSATPGKTATINFYTDGSARIADLPGYGYAKVSKSEKDRWNGLIGGYLGADRDIRLVIQLIDIRHPPSKDDINMINYLIEDEFPMMLVFTKADKLSARQRAERMEGFAQEIPCFDDIVSVVVSSETGEGFEELRDTIRDVLEPDAG